MHGLTLPFFLFIMLEEMNRSCLLGSRSPEGSQNTLTIMFLLTSVLQD
jgi:hypothetical protein